MSNAVCEKCRSRNVVNGRCADCGYVHKKAGNALPVGHLLNRGRYHIVRVLGEGGYGITYEAIDLQSRQRVAVKEFFPAYALRRAPGSPIAVCIDRNTEAAVAHARIRFNQEAALLTALKNVKEIVTVYHSFEDNQTAYYTMELLRGMDMQKHLQSRGKMFWHELSPIVIRVLSALYITHQMGYIHRDITPDNIFLLDDGSIRLIDFGNARRYGQNQQLTAVVKDKFAPREQYNSKGRQGPWTDIYSLCVTIYYALTGVLPKKATEQNPTQDSLPALMNVADVPPAVSRAVQIGMSADESKRYKSIADFAYAMYPGQAVLGTVVRQNASVQKTQKPAQPVPRQSGAQTQNQKEVGRQQMLLCTQGTMKGLRVGLSAGKALTIGRSPGKTIRYPDGSNGVSRNQCCILLQANGGICIRDEASTYGTAVNGQKLIPGVWKLIKRGDTITFGKEIYILY